MTSYVALIRSLNVGGNNKVSMAELKGFMKEFGYQNVSTIGNTGVLFFDSETSVDDNQLGNQLTDKLNVEIKLVTHTFEHLLEIKKQLPTWWIENSEWRYNVGFLLDGYDSTELEKELQDLDSQDDQFLFVDNVLLWSSTITERRAFDKSECNKLLLKKASNYLTIRNANTLDKIFKKIEDK